jgi:hypothetical protein
MEADRFQCFIQRIPWDGNAESERVIQNHDLNGIGAYSEAEIAPIAAFLYKQAETALLSRTAVTMKMTPRQMMTAKVFFPYVGDVPQKSEHGCCGI